MPDRLLISVPMLAFAVVALCLISAGLPRRYSAVLSATICSLVLTTGTELLNLFSAITRLGVLSLWSATLVVAATVLARRRRSGRIETCKPVQTWFAQTRWTLAEKFQLSSIALLLILIGVTAFVAPPNTWDAMVYHMPRVTQWIVHRSIAFFPTVDYQQLMAPPFAEWVILHAQILSGSDRFADLVQFAFYAGSIVATSLVAESLGADRRGQCLAALACATIPLGVLAASGPKNEWEVTFWISATVLFLLRVRRNPAINGLAGGVAAGLACFSKGTAFTLLPCLPLMCVVILRPWRKAFPWATIVAGCFVALLINVPQFSRNYELSGSPFGFSSPDGAGLHRWDNDRVTPGVVVSNIVRNAVLHFGVKSEAGNRNTARLVTNFLAAFGMDANDPGCTWNGTAFHVNSAIRNEVFAGNGLHALLLAAALFILIFRKMEGRGDLLLFCAALIGALAVFCAVLRWQEWNQRLHLPLFALGSAMMGTVLVRVLSKTTVLCLSVALMAGVIPCTLFNTLRPLLRYSHFSPRPTIQDFSIFTKSRAELYFEDRHETSAREAIQAVDEVKRSGCRDVGIDASIEHYEYPLIALLDAGETNIRSRYVGVTNLTARYAGAIDLAQPCAVICPGCVGSTGRQSLYSRTYAKTATFGNVSVFVDISQ